MSTEIKKLIKGIIALILGLIIIYVSIILYFKDVFTYIGFIIVGIGAYAIFINLFKIYNERKIKFSHTHLNQQQKNVKRNQTPQDKILNKLDINYKKPFKNDLKSNHDEEKHSKNNDKLHISSKFKKPNDSNPSKPKTKNKRNSLLKSNHFSDSNSHKSKSIKKNSTQYIFTPNYQKPSKIVRKPVKKFSRNSFKSNKIKPNLSIKQLSKRLGLETKEDEELRRLKKLLTKEKNPQKEDINDLDSGLNDILPNLDNDLDNNVSDLDNNLDSDLNVVSNLNNDILDLDFNNNTDDLETENNISPNNSLDGFNYNPYEESNNLEDKNHTKSYFDRFDEIQILCGGKNLSITKTLEKLVTVGKKKIYIAVPSLNFLSNNTIGELNSLNSKIIIEKNITYDMSHSLIIPSLSKEYVSIRTTQSIENIIVVVDNSYALLVSKPITSAIGVGAVFTKKEEINSVKNTFDMLWHVSVKL